MHLIYIYALVLLFASSGFAMPAKSLRFEQLGVEQGLPQETVFAMAQDQTGFMWFGTQTGLGRYDGFRTTTFKNIPTDINSISDSWVQTLYVDKRGRLWVGTRRGLDLYEARTGRFVHFQPMAAAKTGSDTGINQIVEDSAGNLWLATSDGLAYMRTSDNTFTLFRHNDTQAASLANNHTFALALDRDGALWVGTVAGVDRLAPGATGFEHYKPQETDAGTPKRTLVRSLLLDGKGLLWVGTAAGLERWQFSAGNIQRLPFDAMDGVQTSSIGGLYLDHEGIVWVGTVTDGLKRYDPGARGALTYKHDPTDRHSVGDNYIASVFQDRTGTLWVGTWSAGASRSDLASGGFERYAQLSTSSLGLSNSKVYGISGDGQGTLWLSTREGGLNRLDTKLQRITTYRHDPNNPESLDTDNTLITKLDDRGRLWIATDKGLSYMDLVSGQIRRQPFSTGNALSTALYCLELAHRREELWMCSRGGLHRLNLNTGEIRTFRHDGKDNTTLANDFATSVLEDRSGTLWIGTFGGGLDRWDRHSGQFSHIRHDPQSPDSLSSDRVQNLFEDSHGQLWVGTSSGINRMQHTADGSIRFVRYGVANGIGADSIGALLEDEAGKLWVSSTAGISHFDPKTGLAHHYTASDGLIEGSYFIGSAYRDSDGTLYFGGINGMTALQPKRIHDNPVAPEVVITDLAIFNKSISNGQPAGFTLDGPLAAAKTATLSHALSVFTIEFAALHFADPKRNRYAYQLQGFDSDWNYSDSTRRAATYTNLDPGHYVFRVKAANKDGLWNERGATLDIVITPPFWKTWWFRLASVLMLLSALYVLYRWRVGTLTEQAALLEQKVAERTLQLKQALADLEQASLTDPLTGLQNRRFLLQRLDSDVALCLRSHEKANRMSVPPTDSDLIFFLVDIDHFKQVNDEFGHAAGDAVLIQIKHRLQRVFRESDYLVRWGGEEFLVVARQTERSKAPALAERLRAVFADDAFLLEDGTRLNKTCSIGFASLPFIASQPTALNWSEVVDIADIALYAAKLAGRNAWVGITAGDHATSQDFLAVLKTDPQQLIVDKHLLCQTNVDVQRVEAAIMMRQHGPI